MKEQLSINLEYSQALHTKAYRTFGQVQEARSGQEVVDLFQRVIRENKLTTRILSESVPMLKNE